MTAALTHQLEQTTPRMLIVAVCFKVFRQLYNPRSQQCDLHFRRPGVTRFSTKVLDNLSFYRFV